MKLALSSFVLVWLTACGGGGSDSDSSPASGATGTSGSTTSSTGFYRRTNGTTALALNGASSYFCSWDDCPGGTTCGVKVNGTDKGATVDWKIPNGSGTTLTTFGITDTNSGLTLTYQGSRVGDYVPVSSWASATQGDGGYCSGTGGATPAPTPAPAVTTGRVAVWTSRSSGSAIAVSIDNVAVGSLTSYYTSTPNCGDSGTVTRTLSVGTHSLKATATGGSWGPANFTVTAGGCLMYQLN